jgi:hypothetical protein
LTDQRIAASKERIAGSCWLLDRLESLDRRARTP